MQDRMTQGDGVQMSMECGHPNVKPNETCPHCGRRIGEVQNSLDELLRQMSEARKDKQ